MKKILALGKYRKRTATLQLVNSNPLHFHRWEDSTGSRLTDSRLRVNDFRDEGTELKFPSQEWGGWGTDPRARSRPQFCAVLRDYPTVNWSLWRHSAHIVRTKVFKEKLWPPNLLPMWFWASHLIFLHLSFLISAMGPRGHLTQKRVNSSMCNGLFSFPRS